MDNNIFMRKYNGQEGGTGGKVLGEPCSYGLVRPTKVMEGLNKIPLKAVIPALNGIVQITKQFPWLS